VYPDVDLEAIGNQCTRYR